MITDFIPSVTRSEAVAVIDAARDAKLAVMIYGAPGVGKTSMVKAIARERGVPCIVFTAAYKDPTGVTGLPYLDRDTVEGQTFTGQTKTLDLPVEEVHGPEGILFLDELTVANQATLNALLELIQERKVGSQEIPAGWRIIAAGNRPEDFTGAIKLPSAVANRLIQVNMDADADEWAEWATEQGMSPFVVAFVKYKGAEAFPQRTRDSSKSPVFASPRSWAHVGKLFDANVNPEVRFKLTAACVGEAFAAELEGFIRLIEDMPPIRDILEGKSKIKLSDAQRQRSGVMYLFTKCLAARANRATEENGYQYLRDNDAQEYLMVYCQSRAGFDKDFKFSSLYAKYAKDIVLPNIN